MSVRTSFRRPSALVPHDNIRFWDIVVRDVGLSGGEVDLLSRIPAAVYCASGVASRSWAHAGPGGGGARRPQSFVSKYESGERRLDVIELGHIAQVLSVTLSDVLERLESDCSSPD
jgi:hypothetical protein